LKIKNGQEHQNENQRAKKGIEANLSAMMAVRARWAGAGQMIIA
jgi:hypothetical protein